MRTKHSVKREGEWTLTKTINGQKVEFRVNGDGEFCTIIAGEFIREDSLKAAESKARALTKKAKRKIALPFTIMGAKMYTPGSHFTRKYLGIGCRDITITGIHAGTGNLLFRYDDDPRQEVHQDTGMGYDTKIVKRMSPEQQEEFRRLYKANSDAHEALSTFQEKFKVKVDELVEQAINQSADDPNEPDETDGDPR